MHFWLWALPCGILLRFEFYSILGAHFYFYSRGWAGSVARSGGWASSVARSVLEKITA